LKTVVKSGRVADATSCEVQAIVCSAPLSARE
jgi:hypothetical protein